MIKEMCLQLYYDHNIALQGPYVPREHDVH